MSKQSMLSVRGRFAGGVAHPAEPVDGREGQTVIITFLDQEPASVPEAGTTWLDLESLIEACAVETGISDLAHQHDHYLYGTAKRNTGDG
jgi:hypothetical protein